MVTKKIGIWFAKVPFRIQIHWPEHERGIEVLEEYREALIEEAAGNMQLT